MNTRIADFNDWLREFGQRFAIITVELMLLVGVIAFAAVAGYLVRSLVPRILVAVRFDRLATKVGMTAMLHRAGLAAPASRYAGVLTGWLFFFLVFIAGAASLNLPWTAHIVDRGLRFIPAFVAAVVILVAGALLAEFVARGILIAAVNAGWRAARIVSAVARVLVLLLASAMALEQIGVAPTVVAATFAILLGGVVLALALAFGLGGRDLARDYLQKRFGTRDQPEPGSELDHL